MINKIAIATLVGQNQGNRLQNYALQKVLADATGADVETFRVPYGPSLVKRIAKGALRPVMPWKRWARFGDFDKRFIHYSRKSTADPSLDAGGYDLFFIGSDQVWNPSFDNTTDAEYLPQVEKGRKFAYAASFGVSEITENREHMAELLSQIRRISVREDAAANIVEGLIGVRPKVVLDPTMLLKPDDWADVAAKPKMDVPAGGYILKYVLGQNVPDDKALAAAGEIDCPIIDLKDESLPVGPSEFIWLIAHAKFVCTDSFHASVFSVLYRTPFAIFERVSANEDMSSRFDTLCATFGLEGRRVRSGELAAPIDWEAVDGRLEHARASSLDYLKGCLDEYA